MADLPLYLLNDDIKILNHWINAEEELFYIIPDGEQRWKAVKQFDLVSQALNYNRKSFPPMIRFWLWLRSSGPLPLLPPKGNNSREDIKKINNPCEGWEELRHGRDSSLPYFGPGHFGVFKLEIWIHFKEKIPKSHIGWIGNQYQKSPEVVHKYWQRIRRMAKKYGEYVHAASNRKLYRKVLAFPAAYTAIQSGVPVSLI